MIDSLIKFPQALVLHRSIWLAGLAQYRHGSGSSSVSLFRISRSSFYKLKIIGLAEAAHHVINVLGVVRWAYKFLSSFISFVSTFFFTIHEPRPATDNDPEISRA